LPQDAEFLTDMLVEAVNWDPGREPLSRAQVLAEPTLTHYVSGWMRPGDLGVVACAPGPVGAAWLREFTAADPGYGFVAPDVPELSIGVLPGWRGTGVGRALLRELLCATDRDRVALSVERANRARNLYLQECFATVAEGPDADTMVWRAH
jgi:GNAT superfamily N-acetyltransferase